MGAAESSLPAVEERTACFRRGPHLTVDLYQRHSRGEDVAGLLTQVPDCLTSRVCLYRALDLSFNMVSALPSELPLTLPHLVSLNLAHNRLAALPDSLLGFLHLRELDVSHNLLETLPPGLCMLERLKKLDVSNNRLARLPLGLEQLQALEKLNLAENPLQHLPLGLGGLPRLAVLLVTPGSPPHPIPLLPHLRSCYAAATAAQDAASSRPRLNHFPRVRGAVFDSRVLNAGSAQSLFSQMQAQAVQTGNRLLTPLIPPVGSTTLDAERLGDAVLGMVYGCLLGDALGQLTVGLSPEEAEFHYNRDHLQLVRGAPDLQRARWGAGEVSPAGHLALLTLDSAIAWAGVLDELDYLARLRQWGSRWGDAITSPTLVRLLARQEGKEMEDDEEEEDCFCLPPVVGVVLAGFHSLPEVRSDALRLCGATHCRPEARAAVTALAEVLARLLQGGGLAEVEELLPEPEGGAEAGPAARCLAAVAAAAPEFQRGGYQAALTQVVMVGGEATVAGCVAGAVYGLLGGYAALPTAWLAGLQADVTATQRRANQLLDLMGIP